jgi:dTDP-4-amino-4,6-dideoxygalactose transaminase
LSGDGYVPFNRPSIVGRELENILEAVRNGHLAGDGAFTRRCERWLEEHCGAFRVLLTHSCTAALEMAALLCDIREGDEVIMPSFTFVSTANAFVLRGATPVFIDIRADTLNIDEQLIAGAISPATRAIVPVHYAGVACDMAAITDIAAKNHLRVIEDAAQGIGASYRSRALGTIGDLGCWSFHETKNLISGEGGALVVQDPALVERAEILREKGTNRSKFSRGEVDKYTWVDVGSSYVPSELIASYLFAQLEKADAINAEKKAIFARYRELLGPLEREGVVRLPVVPADCEPNGHLFYVVVPAEETRDALLAHLASRNVNAVFHYVPLHESPVGRRVARCAGPMTNTESISRRLLRLPSFIGLSEAQQRRVAAAIYEFFAVPMA